MAIPKIIHYCWLSNDPIPEKLQKSMASWKDKLDGYEFVLWNFDRFDINSSIWVKQTFAAKQYAFAADYIRLFAVYNHGGIYLDMDVEVIKPFDDLLDFDIMLAVENDNTGGIEAGCFGAEKGHPYIKKCLDYYDNRKFVKLFVAPFLMKSIKDKYFGKADYHIHSADYFTAKDQKTGFVNRTKNTYTIHHFAGSWIADKDKKAGINQWYFFEKYGNDEFLVDLFDKLQNNSPKKMPLKQLWKIVVERTAKKIIGKRLMDLTRNVRLKIQYDI
jgi:mannosyltransferase OCH1-like enzyme